MAKRIVKKKIRVARKLEFPKLNQEKFEELIVKNNLFKAKINSLELRINKFDLEKNNLINSNRDDINKLIDRINQLDKILEEHLHCICECDENKNNNNNRTLANRKTTRNNNGSEVIEEVYNWISI